jgi:hypothetical protein
MVTKFDGGIARLAAEGNSTAKASQWKVRKRKVALFHENGLKTSNGWRDIRSLASLKLQFPI